MMELGWILVSLVLGLVIMFLPFLYKQLINRKANARTQVNNVDCKEGEATGTKPAKRTERTKSTKAADTLKTETSKLIKQDCLFCQAKVVLQQPSELKNYHLLKDMQVHGSEKEIFIEKHFENIISGALKIPEAKFYKEGRSKTVPDPDLVMG